VKTNEHGEYFVGDVAPGFYKIVMNKYTFPDSKVPYKTLYWPASPTEADGQVIEVKDAVPQQSYDFSLPPAPKMVKVTGIVVGADGRPAQGVHVLITALPDNSIAIDDQNMPETDADGHFSFTALEGFDYSLHAIQSGTKPWHSAEVLFSLNNGQYLITLVMDRPGRFDNDPIERARPHRD